MLRFVERLPCCASLATPSAGRRLETEQRRGLCLPHAYVLPIVLDASRIFNESMPRGYMLHQSLVAASSSTYLCFWEAPISAACWLPACEALRVLGKRGLRSRLLIRPLRVSLSSDPLSVHCSGAEAPWQTYLSINKLSLSLSLSHICMYIYIYI